MRYTLTFHYPKNYGAFLQTFALQIVLGDSIVLNFVPRWSFFVSARFPLPIRWFIGSLRKKKSLSNFPEKKYIKVSKSISSEKDAFFLKNEDCLIVGSDQIWNPLFINDQFIYFGKFSKKNIKLVSYAASLGMAKWPTDFEKVVLPMLNRFNAVSVREKSSVEYLESIGIKNVVCVCDPTILHDGNFYRHFFKCKKSNKKYSFIYMIREQIPKEAKEILLSKTIYVTLDDFLLPSISQWLEYIDQSEFVITDSFHCVVFCLLFHKPFLIIPNQAKGMGMNERFATLLGKTHLEYRFLTGQETSDEVLEKLNNPIDWNSVDQILDEWRIFSLNWLKKALEK